MISEAPSEACAIRRADDLYNFQLLDTVAVVECDTKANSYNTIYKRERRCKHSNIQFTLTKTGVEPTCECCGLVMKVEEEMVNEER
jgi:hypothetical protein